MNEWGYPRTSFLNPGSGILYIYICYSYIHECMQTFPSFSEKFTTFLMKGYLRITWVRRLRNFEHREGSVSLTAGRCISLVKEPRSSEVEPHTDFGGAK